MEPLQNYTVVVTRTHTAVHEGLVHVTARTEREAEVMANGLTLSPKRWRKVNESTTLHRKLRDETSRS